MLSYKDISWEIFRRFCFVNYCPIHLKDSFGARVQVKRVFDGAPLERDMLSNLHKTGLMSLLWQNG